MFKRVTKRERKREKEEELGLGEEMKQVLGLQDTDSDESLYSSSDSESGDHSDVEPDAGEEVDGEDPNFTNKGKRSSLDSISEFDGIREESNCSDVEAEADGDEDEDGPPMSVMAATTDPIYDLPNSPPTQDLRACILCPGKVIKNPEIARVHLASNAHRRRLQRYTAEVSKRVSSEEGLNTDDPRDILRDMSDNLNYGAQVGTSNRSRRRTQWKEKEAERRRSRKEKGKKMAIEKSKAANCQEDDPGGTTKKKAKKAKTDSSSAGVSGALAMAKTTLDPKPAEKSQHKELLRSGLVEPKLNDSQARPKKRQKR